MPVSGLEEKGVAFSLVHNTEGDSLLVVEILKAKMSETDDILLTRYKIVF